MTDKYNGLLVALDRDIRDDDAVKLIEAIKMIKGVLSVTGSIVGITDYIAEQRARAEIVNKVLEALEQ